MSGTSRLFAGVTAVVAVLAFAVPSPAQKPFDDPVLDDSQRRLAKTAAAVDALGAPPAERLLFMQAESFHRYRFQAPKTRRLPFQCQRPRKECEAGRPPRLHTSSDDAPQIPPAS